MASYREEIKKEEEVKAEDMIFEEHDEEADFQPPTVVVEHVLMPTHPIPGWPLGTFLSYKVKETTLDVFPEHKMMRFFNLEPEFFKWFVMVHQNTVGVKRLTLSESTQLRTERL